MNAKVYRSTFLDFWENTLFFDTNEKKAKLLDPERVQTFAIKHRTKNMHRRCIFFVFCGSNMTSLMGEILKIWRGKKTLLVHCWIAQSMDFIFLQ